MKKVSLLFVLFIFASTSMVFGQEGKKALKEGEKLVKKYTKDVMNSDVDISTAVSLINKAFESDEVSGEAKNHIKKASLLNMISESEYIHYSLNQSNYSLKVPDASIMALDAYKKAMDLGETKKALSGLVSLEGLLNNSAAYYYNSKDYGNAFKTFKSTLEARELLTSNGKESRLDFVDPETETNLYEDQVLFTAVSAYYSDNPVDGQPYFEQLRALDRPDPVIYEALYAIVNKTDPDKAITYLAEGRERNPGDTGMLFAEINHYLKSGELQTLIGKLDQAIAAEPENVSVYTTLGSVYDQLTQTETAAGNKEKAAEYFEKAKTNFALATSKDANNFDAMYSLGALYYNKAAAMVEDLNTLAADFSADGMKKYDAKKAEMDDLFKVALPYFQKAEGINGSDKNTLIALKEIHARLNDLVKSDEYKAKIEGM